MRGSPISSKSLDENRAIVRYALSHPVAVGSTPGCSRGVGVDRELRLEPLQTVGPVQPLRQEPSELPDLLPELETPADPSPRRRHSRRLPGALHDTRFASMSITRQTLVPRMNASPVRVSRRTLRPPLQPRLRVFQVDPKYPRSAIGAAPRDRDPRGAGERPTLLFTLSRRCGGPGRFRPAYLPASILITPSKVLPRVPVADDCRMRP